MSANPIIDHLFFGDVNLEDYATTTPETPDLSFRRIFVEISQLLVERWLQTERGVQFANDVNDLSISDPRQRMKLALAKQGIPLASWITPVPDTDSFQGSIVCDESQASLALLWNIPYTEWPKTAVGEDVLVTWVKMCEQWLEEAKKDPHKDFPEALSVFIPLATT